MFNYWCHRILVGSICDTPVGFMHKMVQKGFLNQEHKISHIHRDTLYTVYASNQMCFCRVEYETAYETIFGQP